MRCFFLKKMKNKTHLLSICLPSQTTSQVPVPTLLKHDSVSLNLESCSVHQWKERNATGFDFKQVAGSLLPFPHLLWGWVSALEHEGFHSSVLCSWEESPRGAPHKFLSGPAWLEKYVGSQNKIIQRSSAWGEACIGQSLENVLVDLLGDTWQNQTILWLLHRCLQIFGKSHHLGHTC